MLASLAACTTVEQRVLPPEEAEQRVAVAFAASPTRDDLLLRLGAPSAVFENGRILAWRLVERDGRGLPAAPAASPDFGEAGNWSRARFSLVVVFDRDGRTLRHSLVAVR